MHGTFEKIYEIVKMIPRGRVSTYGQIAHIMGNPRLSRVVGYALHANSDPENVPCYRVVNRHGFPAEAFVFGGANVQTELLMADGVEFIDGHVDMKKYLWKPETEII